MSEDLKIINEALLAENGSLKNLINGLHAEKQALEQTVMDLLKANIALRSATVLYEGEVKKLKDEIVILEKVKNELELSAALE